MKEQDAADLQLAAHRRSVIGAGVLSEQTVAWLACLLPTTRVEETALKVAIPRVGTMIAPRFEHSATITIYTIRDRKVVEEVDFSLRSEEALDRIRLLRAQGVDTLICGGVQRTVENILVAHGINAITWVSGAVDELLELFLRGRLVAGSGRPGRHG